MYDGGETGSVASFCAKKTDSFEMGALGIVHNLRQHIAAALE